MLLSMTGFATHERLHQVASESWTATWDVRSVNAKGLDIRLRLPDWVPGLEADTRKALSASLGRGSVQLSLKLVRNLSEGPQVNTEALSQVLTRLSAVEELARAQGIELAPVTALDVLAQRGVQDAQDLSTEDAASLAGALSGDLPLLIDALVTMRRQEGAQLVPVLASQIDDISELTDRARGCVERRTGKQKSQMGEALARLEKRNDLDESRLMQELALIAVKSDISEELDRLAAHVATARDLLAAKGPVGRKLDFLCQEFNREANTLCAKSGDTELTRVGLELKTRIEQFREQIQNVE